MKQILLSPQDGAQQNFHIFMVRMHSGDKFGF